MAWGAQMQSNALEYETRVAGINARQQYALLASFSRWFGVFCILYPVEFLCLIIPKLMMLGRLTNNATRCLQAYARDQEQSKDAIVRAGALVIVYRVIAAVVMMCSVGEMVALDVSGAHRVQYAGLCDQAAAACDAHGNDTNSSLALFYEANAFFTYSGTALSVYGVLEAIALLLISAAYLILVPLSVAMFRRAERVGAHALVSVAARASAGDRNTEAAAAIVDDTVHAAAEQRRRLVIACVVVLITFPFRAAVDLLLAYILFDNPYNPACGQCDHCQSDRFLIRWWLIYTPEFRPVVAALSSPLPLLVSLWIITGAHAQAYAISLSILRARLGR